MDPAQEPENGPERARWVGGLADDGRSIIWFESSRRELIARRELEDGGEGWRPAAVELALRALERFRGVGSEAPASLAVADDELRAILEARRGEVEVEITASDPVEVAEFIAELRDEENDQDDDFDDVDMLDEVSTLSTLPDAVVASFHRAAAQLLRAEPWARLPPGLVLVSVPSIGLEELVVLSQGDDGDDYESLLFESPADLQAYVEATAGTTPGDSRLVPTVHVRSFTFLDAESLPAEHLALVEARGWELATGESYPSLVHLAPDGEVQPVDARDLALAALTNDSLAQLPEHLAESRSPRGAKIVVAGPSRSLDVIVRLRALHDTEEDRERYDPARGPGSVEDWLASDEMERLRLIDAAHQVDDRAHAMVHMLAENAVAGDERPLFRETLARLVEEGLVRHDAVHAIGVTMTEHMYDVMESKRPYRASDLEKTLGALTAEGWRAFVESLEDAEQETKPRPPPRRSKGQRGRRRRGKRGR